jgi:hypothetical protein
VPRTVTHVRDDNIGGQPNPNDPGTFGLTKVAYSVSETLNLLSIGRTTFYQLVGRGDLKITKLGSKSLVYVIDIVSLLIKLRGNGGTPAPLDRRNWKNKRLTKPKTNLFWKAQRPRLSSASPTIGWPSRGATVTRGVHRSESHSRTTNRTGHNGVVVIFARV